MATKNITFNNGQTLLPSDRKMTEPTHTLPDTDERDASPAFSPESVAPLNPGIAEFNIADDPSTPTTIVKYEYDPSEDCDVEFDSDSDGEEEVALALAEQRCNKDKSGSLSAGTHFRDADAMNGCKSDEGVARHQASVKRYSSPRVSSLKDNRYEGTDNSMAEDANE